MERRKLVIEKVLDGELYIRADAAGNTPSILQKHKPMEAFGSGAPVFVFDGADVDAAAAAITQDEYRRVLANLPYPVLFVEVRRAPKGYNFVAYITRNPATAILFVQDDDRFVDLLGVSEGFVDNLGASITTASDVRVHPNSRFSTLRELVQGGLANSVFALSLLNVQGDVVRERLEAPAEVNAKRAKRGKPQLQPYTYVYLNRETDHSTSGEPTGRVVSQHIRRGHFKRTRHGTFWWRPCVVGSGPAKERKAYIVKS